MRDPDFLDDELNYDISDEVGQKFNDENNMKGIFEITWTNVKSALVSGLITGFLGTAGYIIGVGDVFKIDVHSLTNVFVLSALTSIVSLIKSGLTTNRGNFLGQIEVVPEKE